MPRGLVNGVFRLADCLDDEPRRVLVGQAVERTIAVLADADQLAPTELRQVLRDGRGAPLDQLGQIVDRQLAVSQREHDADARRVCQEPEDLYGDLDISVRGREVITVSIYVHTQILT